MAQHNTVNMIDQHIDIQFFKIAHFYQNQNFFDELEICFSKLEKLN